MAHLLEQLGDERFAILINPYNMGKVREFCDHLLKDALPTEMTVGGQTYEILDFLKGDEESVAGHIMVDRAKEMNANLGKDDGKHILKHQYEIPLPLREKVAFVFPDWRHPASPEHASYVYWNGVKWAQRWGWLSVSNWDGRDRVLRRK